MPFSRFSTYVLSALVNVITGGSATDPKPPIGLYRTGPEIEQFFLKCGVDMRLGSASRVPATTDCLREVWARPDSTAVIERLILRVSDPRDYLDWPGKGQAVIERLNGVLEADGYAVMIVDGKPQLLARQAHGPILSAVIEKTALLDFDTVQRDISRACKAPRQIPKTP